MTTDRSPSARPGHDEAGAPSVLARLAGREARCLALTTRVQPPPVIVVPEPCTGCGADRSAAEAHARTMPFAQVSVAAAVPRPLGDPVVLTVLACERLNASVLIALTHLHEHREGPLHLRTRSATAQDLARRRPDSSAADLLHRMDRAEAWYDRFSAGERGALEVSAHGPHTLPVQLDAFAGTEHPAPGLDGVAAVIRALREPFLLPHSPHRPSATDAAAYEQLRTAALWRRLEELNRMVPPGPRVPEPDHYFLLSHPVGPPGEAVPLP